MKSRRRLTNDEVEASRARNAERRGRGPVSVVDDPSVPPDELIAEAEEALMADGQHSPMTETEARDEAIGGLVEAGLFATKEEAAAAFDADPLTEEKE